MSNKRWTEKIREFGFLDSLTSEHPKIEILQNFTLNVFFCSVCCVSVSCLNVSELFKTSYVSLVHDIISLGE